MPPRSRSPYPMPNPRMPQGMMNRGGGPFMHGMGPRMHPPAGMRSGMRPPMGMGQGLGAPQAQRGGGLLSKLLGRGTRQAANTGALPARGIPSSGAAQGGGGLLKALTDPNAINGFLTNTQKVLNSAQQIGPMVQQYGPLVRNIPSLWKLYKGLKDAPDETEESTEGESTSEQPTTRKKSSAKKRASTKQDSKEEEPTQKKGQSVPKLYI